MHLEGGERGRVDRDPPSLVRLGVLLDEPSADVRDRATDRELALLGVDVGPAQRTTLAAPAAGRGEQAQVQRELGVLRRGEIEQLTKHIDRGRLDLLLTTARQGRIARDVE